jgi:flagellar basal-body rod protein FlgG
MAITALHSAATGLRALSTRIDVVANNLANAETLAFKGSRVNFEDLYYLTLKQPGSTNAAQEVSPSGIFVGLGTRLSNTQLDLSQGSLENTTRDWDLGIQGQGFFKIKILDTVGSPPGVGYTRNGNFTVNSNGELLVNMGAGYKLIPPVTVPPGSTNPTVGTDGSVSVTVAGSNTNKVVGQIQISQFLNPEGMSMLGGSIYVATSASGAETVTKPGEGGAGTVLQGYLENSNVDPVKELVTLIQTQRAFELNSQSIQTADQALQTIANLRKG